MNDKHMLYALAAVAGLLAVVTISKNANAQGVLTGQAERASGVSHLFDFNTSQQSAANQAIAQDWANMQYSAWGTDPSIWN